MAEPDGAFAALQDWFASQCDGDWEHRHGVTIQTCDNPGWIVRISLAGTVLENKGFVPMSSGLDTRGHPTDANWIDCRVEGGVWCGAGDPSKLRVITSCFLDWALPGRE